jgi:hypothetical protein
MMKMRIALTVLLGLGVVSAGLAINPQPEPPRVIGLRTLETAPRTADLSKAPVLNSPFVVTSIGALKQSIGNRQPMKVMSVKMGPEATRLSGLRQVQPVALVGNPYAQDKGVVLDAMHSVDAASASSLIVHNVIWNPTLVNQLATQSPQTAFSVRTPNQSATPLADAYFFNLAPGLHTYMLTLGTTARLETIRIRVAGQTMQGAQLLANPSTNEVRVFFTYDSSSEYGNCVSAITWLNYDKPAGYDSYEYFHHLQLAQLD